ncbi:MAG TPA: TIGR02466 family protein [Caulobacterales bacterium]|nr:TIGR02466 family protein [Caulobacterales bacterium]
MAIRSLFVTKLYEARLPRAAALNAELAHAMRVTARDDAAGRRWSAEKNYPGYTSYASLNDLSWRAPAFATLQEALDEHVALFARDLDFDLGGRALSLDSLWINIVKPGGQHTGHIHPHSVISGVYYAELPEGAGGLKLEDPRLAMMMAAPPRKARAATEQRTFHYVRPRAGDILLWESWLRHETEPNQAKADRLSVSFNYKWG